MIKISRGTETQDRLRTGNEHEGDTEYVLTDCYNADNKSIFAQEGSIMSRDTTLHNSLQAGLVCLFLSNSLCSKILIFGRTPVIVTAWTWHSELCLSSPGVTEQHEPPHPGPSQEHNKIAAGTRAVSYHSEKWLIPDDSFCLNTGASHFFTLAKTAAWTESHVRTKKKIIKKWFVYFCSHDSPDRSPNSVGGRCDSDINCECKYFIPTLRCIYSSWHAVKQAISLISKQTRRYSRVCRLG